MSELVVLSFDGKDSAFEARDRLIELQKEQLVTLKDAAVVVRNEDGGVDVKQAQSLVGAGALGGAFWGMLVGLLFWMPWLGLAIGTITGAISGKYADYGIDDNFIREVGDTIEPGDSALFLLVEDVVADRVIEEMKQFDPEVVRTNLSGDEERNLRDAFAAEEIEA
ncbi:DUF1269 domain-containing protein [Halorussus caseinilyticus]|uniref:DUF1269 domain-containing protein n=1 Tax=Halorussus caseinilyticus TaxID=3034025 RepID=UPI0023E8D812|nr:DUF1269 domain-containing protein [Halorussus sp. DT72]